VAEPICYFFDQHIQSGVTNGLRQRGVDVLTAQDAARCGLPDADQLQFATSQERVVVTFDPDYLALAATGVRHSGIAWCHARKYSIGELIHMLLLLQAVFSRDEMKDRVEYL
jgi:predicted nuclease of predicted toxin-antitoxin system